jgi:large subunit ribosomal protein L4
LKVVENFVLEAPKTKLFLRKVKDMGVSDSLLLITDELDDNLVLSSRNLPNVLVLEVTEADPVSLIRYKNVILTRKAVSKFEEMLG